jgi:hypothetical protein
MLGEFILLKNVQQENNKISNKIAIHYRIFGHVELNISKMKTYILYNYHVLWSDFMLRIL